MKKLRVLLALVIATTLALVGCGQKDTEKSNEGDKNPFEKVAARYENQIQDYENIDFEIEPYGSENATYTYKYALVNMNDDEIPELIIGRTDESVGVQYNKIFYYDKENNKLLSPTKNIEIGVAAVGGMRADLTASNKNDGLILNQGSGMTGQFEIVRINLDIKEDRTIELKNTKIKEYMLGGEPVEDDGESIAINWYEINDLSALEAFKEGKLDLTKKPEENKDSQVQENAETKPVEEPKESGVKVDNRNVFEGTLKYLSYNEVLDLQDMEDPNGGYADTSEKFALLVFDEEIVVTANSGDGEGSRTEKAKMIKLANFADASNYNGKRVKVRVKDMFWPSDTSLPFGQPYALEGNYEIVE